jgi:hypothetical protein
MYCIFTFRITQVNYDMPFPFERKGDYSTFASFGFYFIHVTSVVKVVKGRAEITFDIRILLFLDDYVRIINVRVILFPANLMNRK